jgi:hypothetical protein
VLIVWCFMLYDDSEFVISQAVLNENLYGHSVLSCRKGTHVEEVRRKVRHSSNLDVGPEDDR